MPSFSVASIALLLADAKSSFFTTFFHQPLRFAEMLEKMCLLAAFAMTGTDSLLRQMGDSD